MKFGWLMVGLVGAALIGGTVTTMHSAVAQTSAADAIKARKDVMHDFGGAFGPINRVVRGEDPNVTGVTEKAMIWANAAKKLPPLFPAGSGRESGQETRAKPEIWSNRAEFDADINKLVVASTTLADVAKTGDLGAVKAQFAVAVQACQTCHGGPNASGGPFRFEAPPRP